MYSLKVGYMIFPTALGAVGELDLLYNILICMVMATAGRGRPCSVAEIPFSNERKVKLLQEFYGACATFRYPEIMAVSRALGVHRATVERWKYQLTFPRWDIAVDVIEWVRQGKPTKVVPPSEALAAKVM